MSTLAPVHDIADTTPMMAQYLALKAQHPDCILLFRLGDFYEVFLSDAPKVASALGIQLTKRGKHQGEDIAMCGVPWHQLDNYLPELIKHGYKVALCEQTEDPAEAKKRGGKTLVERAVVRIVTAGTLTEDTLLEASANNYLAAITVQKNIVGMSWVDLSTGVFCTHPTTIPELGNALASINPSEILVPQKLQQTAELFDVWRAWKSKLTFQPDSTFHPVNTLQTVLQFYSVSTLEAFGDFTSAETSAAGALLNYIALTQKGGVPQLNPLRAMRAQHTMRLDAATRRNLELTKTLNGSNKGTLLSVIDYTQTAAGGRLLRQHFAHPLAQANAINERLAHVTFWVLTTHEREKIQGLLKNSADSERALSRLSLGRGNPRDLAAIRDSLIVAEKLAGCLGCLDNMPVALQTVRQHLPVCHALTALLSDALAPDLPLFARDGGFIKAGYHPKLDDLRRYATQGMNIIRNLEQEYQQQTKLPSLKIKHNGVLGYFIEVSSKVADALKEPFIHRQTLSNAARFTTEQLNNLQSTLIKAEAEVKGLENEIFQTLITETLQISETVRQAAHALALLDVTTGHAQCAIQEKYCCPVIEEGYAFDIINGRHAVVEQALDEGRGNPFMPNSCKLEDDASIWLLTGPNMAGKSTFLRQNALIVLMAQIGCFVPATAVRLGVVDAIYSRVGAGDDLAQGRSTFMVEMVETATIINQATPASLVILDEIGRGTATFDGVAIAWATLEHLYARNKCRTLFATHYHELTQLEERLDTLKNYTMRVEETSTGIVFLHQIDRGKAGRSYGIFVAQLAGMPLSILERAEDILQRLEKTATPQQLQNLPLFTPQHFKRTPTHNAPTQLVEALQKIDTDTLSPKEAHTTLQMLKGLL